MLTHLWKRFWFPALLIVGLLLMPFQNNADAASNLSFQTSLQNGQMVVTASFTNTNDGGNIGLIATGYTAEGEAISTKGGTAYIARGKTGNYQITLDHGDKIAKVIVVPADPLNPAGKLSSSAYYEGNGKGVVTAVVENGGEGRNIGVIAVGYDGAGKAIETKAATAYIGKNYVGNYQIVLDYAASIASVKTFISDTSNPTAKISSEATHKINGKTVVTAVVENGGEGRSIGVFAVGYDANGKAVTTKGSSNYLGKNFVANYQIVLDQTESIAGVKVYLADVSNPTLKLSSQANTLINGKMVVTAVVENGGEGRTVGVFAVGYDANGKAVTTQGANNYIGKHFVSNYQLNLDHGDKIASTKVFLVDLVNPAAKVSSLAYTPVNGTLNVTAVVENGGEGKAISATAVGYDANGKAISSKTSKMYIGKQFVGNYQFSLPNAGKIASVKITLSP
ncbi:hypothetical protein NDK47_06425 [Brevibacillus ruminantium]|uniref:Uncharacterized protein n=1 Tax=Brevibacillus ruminantium TaxID=2950604 RepID=A0ABY4WIF3_9BACL|nr:hypothetical protein [Brevibacillus ruminantium]USG66928.1 hypothetical protein NDK47_06425 [Brevibacillus ruminantium]